MGDGEGKARRMEGHRRKDTIDFDFQQGYI